MKTDKKALLYVILLSIVTVALTIALIAYGWNYLDENVLEGDFVDSVKEWFADEDDDYDEDRYADDEEEEEAEEEELSAERGNTKSPEERVYDYADVLTDEEEDMLREYIEASEETALMDIVIVTLDDDIEGEMDMDWDDAMQEYAEAFYDDNKYGYNKPGGDGVLLLDNWYSGQAGSWISTSGRMVDEYSQEYLDTVFDAMFNVIEEDPYEAYWMFVYLMTNY